MVLLSIMSLIVSLIASIIDGIAAYLLLTIDFSKCFYTKSSMFNECEHPDCTAIEFPDNTCYCCYIMEQFEQNQCSIPFLLGRQHYYSNVNSCSDIAGDLLLVLVIVVILHIFNCVLSAISIFQTNPITMSNAREKINYVALTNNSKENTALITANEMDSESGNNKDTQMTEINNNDNSNQTITQSDK